MAIQIIPESKKKYPALLNVLFYLSFILLIVAVIGCFILYNFQKKADENLQFLKNELEKWKTPEALALEKEVSDYQKKIEDFAFLINNHRLNSALFTFIQNNTHPKVWFSSFDLNSDERRVKLPGLTDSFQTLGQQLLIFKEETLIKDIKLSNVSFGKEGRVGFTFDLLLDPRVFQK